MQSLVQFFLKCGKNIFFNAKLNQTINSCNLPYTSKFIIAVIIITHNHFKHCTALLRWRAKPKYLKFLFAHSNSIVEELSQYLMTNDSPPLFSKSPKEAIKWYMSVQLICKNGPFFAQIAFVGFKGLCDF